MARIFRNMEIVGKTAFALFDTGSLRSYVRRELASDIRQRVPRFRVGLGGHVLELDEVCLLNCAMEGLGFDMKAYPVEKIGKDERGREIDAIVGATAMEEWGFILNPQTGEVDLTALRRREFTEF